MTVDFDAGGSQGNVIAPPALEFGEWPEDTTVLIEEIDGEWYVVWVAVTLTAITSLRREAGKLQYKTTQAAVFIVGDEDDDWTEVEGQDDIVTHAD